MMQALWLSGMLFANLWTADGDKQTPILPPIQAGQHLDCIEEPDHAEILRALPGVTCIPFLYDEWRDDVTINVEKLVDRVDPPRFFPLVGQAQLHHVHWKCTVSFTLTKTSTFPVFLCEQCQCSEVVYIDKDHLHLCAAEKDDAEAQEADSSKPAVRVRACWETGLTGSVYVFSNTTNRTIEAAGRFEVEAFDMAPALTGEAPRLLARWTFDRERLEKLKRKDLIGDGYTLSVNWSDLPAGVTNIKLQTTYVPAQGTACSDEPTYLSPRDLGWFLLRDAPAEGSSKVVSAQAVSFKKDREQGMNLAAVVALSKAGLSNETILRQMEATKRLATVRAAMKADEFAAAVKQMSVILLTADDLIELKHYDVSEELIRAMQDRMIEALQLRTEFPKSLK